MLLRKRLTGGRIRAIEQPRLDRVVSIEFEARDELGDTVLLKLVVELMGKYSNICFLNQSGAILDCARHVDAGMSSVRMLLPGIIYAPPPRRIKSIRLMRRKMTFLKPCRGAEACINC
jgi:predicted ribosome quality control (RQC) complex YloA/Tae2 family protein